MFYSNLNILQIVAFRLCCCFFSCTWFVPDEYFQSVEVAYHMVYAKGHLTWEWLPDWALRSPLHPIIYAFPFWILNFFSLDFVFIIKWLPNIIQALLFAVADFCYINWAKNIIGSSQKEFSLLLTLYFTNWFIIYCSTRTLSNTLECCFTLIALNFYVKKDEKKLKKKKKNDDDYFKEEELFKNSIFKINSNNYYSFCLIFVALAAVIRPTTCLLWSYLCFCHFLDFYTNKNEFNNFGKNFLYRAGYYFLSYFPIAFIIPIFTFLIDSYYYGQPTFTFFNFFNFNILQSGNSLFGSHPWHWYISQGLPSVFGFAFIPLIIFLFKLILYSFPDAIKLPKRYAFAAFLYIFGLSLITHKEHRFVLPIIPLLLPYIAVELNSYKSKYLTNCFKNLIIIFNLLAIFYFGLIHQRGPYIASNQIAQYVNAQLKLNNNRTIYVLQLMPCFSMPMYAAIHPFAQNVSIRMLDCGINDKIEESDQFHSSPEFWLNKYWFTKQFYLTDIIICYQQVFVQIEPFLMQKEFKRYSLIFHTIFTSSSRQNSKIILLTKN